MSAIEQSERKKSYFSKAHTSWEKKKKGEKKWKEFVLFLKASVSSRFLSEHLCKRSNIYTKKPTSIWSSVMYVTSLLLDSGWLLMIQLNNCNVTPGYRNLQTAVGGQRDRDFWFYWEPDLQSAVNLASSLSLECALCPQFPQFFKNAVLKNMKNMTLREPTRPWESRVLPRPSEDIWLNPGKASV